MTRYVFLLSCLASFACTPQEEQKFSTLEEACQNEVPGENQIENDPAAIEAVGRVNCYRRLAGVVRGAIDPFVLEGTHNHIDWVIINDTFQKSFNLNGRLS